ncbi:TRAP transporter substrate-binding protein [Marinobacterium rhizophilum]|uniref:TRAP transporter substrate-binding protein n=1 Tax=Marinobacterium rhizophilum TaxID=420402 RepID=A0ABY5HIV1_9GAMM|nr:TRAP transporter substrate-binding protein [Marinobacterium rhizophilum]UTW12300.1 TRAP transporter substrate-binding protein [Marinobacterium rhizophilum]
MSRRILFGLAASVAMTCAQADTLSLKVLGQPAGSGLIQQQKEQPFFENFAKHSGLDATVQYLPVDVAGIPDTDALRVLQGGLFDIVSIRGSQASRDEPILLGFDLVGLNASFEEGKRHTDAFFDTVDQRLQSNFNTKLLGVWPAGPQVIFCKPEVTGLKDLAGLKIRVGDQSVANFVAGFGATGVPMPFGEVQQALARGVVECAITGPASANSGGWPEATTTVLPLALQLAINGYGINLKTWNSLSDEDKAKLQGAIDTLVADIWSYSEELYEDALRCNTGDAACQHGTLYKLKLQPVADADLAIVKEALTAKSLPVWAEQCNAVNPSCESDWNATVGAQLK